MKRVINWFKKENKNYTFVAGGRWKKYDGWDYTKIELLLSVMSCLGLILYIIFKN